MVRLISVAIVVAIALATAAFNLPGLPGSGGSGIPGSGGSSLPGIGGFLKNIIFPRYDKNCNDGHRCPKYKVIKKFNQGFELREYEASSWFVRQGEASHLGFIGGIMKSLSNLLGSLVGGTHGKEPTVPLLIDYGSKLATVGLGSYTLRLYRDELHPRRANDPSNKLVTIKKFQVYCKKSTVALWLLGSWASFFTNFGNEISSAGGQFDNKRNTIAFYETPAVNAKLELWMYKK